MTVIPVFDVGRVLIDWQPDLLLEDLLGGPEALKAFHAEVDFMAWHGEQDRGRTVEQAMVAARRDFPAHAEAMGQLYERWNDTIPGPIDGTHVILERLVERGPVYAITNFPAHQWPKSVDRFPFLTLFTDVVVSGEVALMKPDPAIYRLLLERNGLTAGDCLFIDDSPRNVAAAEGVGMDAVLFTDAPALSAALAERGIVV
ncbi:MAG: HAD-IA family hydrolase [Pseudomonadota bacterium]